MLDLSTLSNSGGAVALGIVTWAGGCYVAAPTIGERLVSNGGEVLRCETSLRTRTHSAINEAVAAVPKPAPLPDVGKTFKNTFGMLFGGLENGSEYMERYGRQIEQFGERLGDPVREKAAQAQREYDEVVGRLRRAGELQLSTASSLCECMARSAINNPETRSSIAWHIGTFGLVTDPPLTDCQAAIHRPENAAQCRGVA